MNCKDLCPLIPDTGATSERKVDHLILRRLIKDLKTKTTFFIGINLPADRQIPPSGLVFNPDTPACPGMVEIHQWIANNSAREGTFCSPINCNQLPPNLRRITALSKRH